MQVPYKQLFGKTKPATDLRKLRELHKVKLTPLEKLLQIPGVKRMTVRDYRGFI